MKTIKLNISGFGRYDDVSPFIVTDNVLELQIELPQVNGEFYIVTELNSKRKKLRLPQDGVITLHNLTAGEMQAEVKHYLKGVLIKKYRIEPLMLIEVDGDLTGAPEIAALNARISALEKELAETNESVFRLNDGLAKAKESISAQQLLSEESDRKINALINFAYTAYNASVYLNGGDKAAFAEEFGFNPEDIKDGGQDNE